MLDSSTTVYSIPAAVPVYQPQCQYTSRSASLPAAVPVCQPQCQSTTPTACSDDRLSFPAVPPLSESGQIDVETVDEPANLTEPDEAAARAAMDECCEHVAGARDVPDDLIEQIDQ